MAGSNISMYRPIYTYRKKTIIYIINNDITYREVIYTYNKRKKNKIYTHRIKQRIKNRINYNNMKEPRYIHIKHIV